MEHVSFLGGRFNFYGEHAEAMRNYRPDVEPAPAPPWLYKWAERMGWRVGNGAGNGRAAEPLADGEVIKDGRRDGTLTSMAGAMRRRGFDGESIYAALASVNERLCDPPLDDPTVRKIARSVSRYEPDEAASVTVERDRPDKQADGKPKLPPESFPALKPASTLVRSPDSDWLWHGILSRGSLTLLTALWKSGKTTLIAHLLKQLEEGGEFCGLRLRQGKIIYVTEESENKWAERRDSLTLRDNVQFLIRPFRAKPDWARWAEFLGHLGDLQKSHKPDLIVLDPLSNLWPVKDENDAAQVQAALMPLHYAFGDSCGLLVHHNRKGDGQEATAARGSGALSAFVDTIIELRRFEPGNKKDRRRVLTGYGRHDETPTELVVELTANGFESRGEKQDIHRRDIATVLKELLPTKPPGLSMKQIEECWPEDECPRNARMLDALHHGVDLGWWMREGEGVRGNPYTFWRAP
jgi:hypothetical protein